MYKVKKRGLESDHLILCMKIQHLSPNASDAIWCTSLPWARIHQTHNSDFRDRCWQKQTGEPTSQRRNKTLLCQTPARYGMESPNRVNAFWGQSETKRISACGRTHLRTGVWQNRPETSGPAALFHPNPLPAPAVPAASSASAPLVAVPADPPNHGDQCQRSRVGCLRWHRRADPELSQTSVWVHFSGSADRWGW